MALPGSAFNAGASSVFYNGRGALEAAQLGKGAGKILSDTTGGKILAAIDAHAALPEAVWGVASAFFALNAKGTVQVFLRPSGGPIWPVVESPILNFLGRGILPR